MGEMGRSELQADFGKLAGVVLAQVFGEVVLKKPDFQRPVLYGAPFLVAATGFPVGDVALGDDDADLVESVNDAGVGKIVAEHAIDHVALNIGQAGDFAVACASPWGMD